jgi:capsular polysaccharide biosynthesis protein
MFFAYTYNSGRVLRTERDFRVESFTAREFIGHARARARFILLVCASAGVLALIASLLIPKEYTARASLVIDPPAGSDPRMSVTASPVYFESLRAYETLASGDSLFLRAAEKFHLRDGPLETLKRRVLRVTKLRETKILEIAVTLHDPAQAQAMAQYLAEETVAANRDSNARGEREMLAEAQKNADTARQRLDEAQEEWREFSVKRPIEGLRSEMEALGETRYRIRRNLVDSRAELAEAAVRKEEEREIQARVESLEKQDAELEGRIERSAAALSDRESRGDGLEAKVRETRTAYEAAATHVRELEAAEGTRSDRLRLIDPGVVPEKASFPLTGLNVALAIGIAFLACFAYLALTFRATLSRP